MTCVHGMYIVVQLGHGQHNVHECSSVQKWQVGMSVNEFPIMRELKWEFNAVGLVLHSVVFST